MSEQKEEPVLAQSDQFHDSQTQPTLTQSQFTQLVEAQASHALSQQFKEKYTDTQLIEVYSSAYKFHKREADKMKILLNELTGSIVPDLDKPELKLTYDVSEVMKNLVVQKNNAMQ